LALGAEATFVARTHDMDRAHMLETFKRAHEHKGASFVEVYQNCNVFNDGAFEGITSKENRSDNLIPLVHGEKIIFGANNDKCVAPDAQGHFQVQNVADVDASQIVVHDETLESPGHAFSLGRLAHGPHEPTPIGVFRDVQRADYGQMVGDQLVAAQEQRGAGDLAALLRSGSTWEVN
jgi:2-oxoglutarate ferredoxin oxidoreductase subunit beta